MKTLKKISPYIICSIIVIVIFLTTLKLNNSYPFGPYDIAKFDAIHQYKTMLYNFLMKIKENILLPYSINNALGNATIFNYLYYLASPINLLLLPFNNPNIIYLLCILIKIVISSITATFYGMKKTSNKLISIIIGISYTYSGWFLAYYFHIMWLDAFMIFPLFQYSLEKLINENKSMLYIFTLAYIMISNFYIAFIICLYTFFYYMYNIILKKEKYLYKIKNFQLIMFSTIITMLLCAFHIYATYDSFLKVGILINSNLISKYNASILDTISSFLSGNAKVILSPNQTTIPNISLNLIFLISFIYYFFNKKIKFKNRILNFIVLILTIFIFHSPTANFIINCFHVPVGFNYRYSFLFSFFIIYLFIQNYNSFDKKINKITYLINLVICAIIIILKTNNIISNNQLIINLTFLIAYTIYFLFYSNTKIYKILFLFIIICETIINSCININSTELINKENDFLTEHNTFRIDDGYIEHIQNHNKNLYTNENTINSFTSVQYTKTLNFLYLLGCPTDSKAMIYKCNNTKVFNTILNIKNDNYNYYLEKIYSVNKNIKNPIPEQDTLYEYQNSLLKHMTNIENIFTTQYFEQKENSYMKKININKNGIYYIQPINDYNYVKVNNEILTTRSDIPQIYKNNKYVIKKDNYQIIKYLNENDTIDIYFEKGQTPPEVYIYTLDEEKYKQAYEYLSKNQIEYSYYTDSHIEGTINVDENQIIFTSIPYDTSWEIKVDGKVIEPLLLLDSLIGIECSPGKHKISMQYKNKNLIIPTVISLLTLSILIGYMIHKKRKNA